MSTNRQRTLQRATGLLAASLAVAVATSGVVNAADAGVSLEGSAETFAAGAPSNSLDRDVALLVTQDVAPVQGSRRGIDGAHQRVTVARAALARLEAGDRIRLVTNDPAGTTLRIDDVERSADGATWAGAIAGDPLSSFTLAQAGDAFSGVFTASSGTYALTWASRRSYWWSEVAPRAMDAMAADGVLAPPSARAAGTPVSERPRKKRKSKVRLLVAYTKQAKAEAGSRSVLKANAKLLTAQTNQVFKNSGVKAKIRLAGLVQAKGKASGNELKDIRRMARLGDGKFDNLARLRKRKRADLIHMFVPSHEGLCGAGFIPTPRRADRRYGVSASTLNCIPYLVGPHEIGHNLGGDHNKYPGVTHNSPVRYSHGYVNPDGGYLTLMGYYDPCYAVGRYDCIRIPYLSSPKRTYNGAPLGSGRKTNNRKVVQLVVRKVARYLR